MVWETKKLAQIGEIFSGNSINAELKKEKYFGLEVGAPYVATKDISYHGDINYENGVKIPLEDFGKFKIAHSNSILICAEGGSAGRKLAFNTRDICFVNKLFALEPKKEIAPKFIYYFYQTEDFKKQFKSKITGLIGGVSIGKFKKIEIPMPSISEQKMIVKILDETFDSLKKAKETAEKNLLNAKELFESYLEEMFSNPGKDWEEKKLGEVCKIIGGGTPSKANRGYYGGDINWATVRDMNTEVIESTEHKITKEAVKNSSTQIIPRGNVIIATRVGLGKICTVGEDTAINQDLKGVVPINSKELSVSFLYRWFKSIGHKIKKEGTGATVQGVKLSFIKSLPILIPPVPRQKAIVSKLGALSKELKDLETVYNKKVQDIEELKRSLLKKAFSGELTK